MACLNLTWSACCGVARPVADANFELFLLHGIHYLCTHHERYQNWSHFLHDWQLGKLADGGVEAKARPTCTYMGTLLLAARRPPPSLGKRERKKKKKRKKKEEKILRPGSVSCCCPFILEPGRRLGKAPIGKWSLDRPLVEMGPARACSDAIRCPSFLSFCLSV